VKPHSTGMRDCPQSLALYINKARPDPVTLSVLSDVCTDSWNRAFLDSIIISQLATKFVDLWKMNIYSLVHIFTLGFPS